MTEELKFRHIYINYKITLYRACIHIMRRWIWKTPLFARHKILIVLTSEIRIDPIYVLAPVSNTTHAIVDIRIRIGTYMHREKATEILSPPRYAALKIIQAERMDARKSPFVAAKAKNRAFICCGVRKTRNKYRELVFSALSTIETPRSEEYVIFL